MADEHESLVKETVERVLKHFSRLKTKEGKKVMEIFPNMDWDKGKAIKKLCEILDVDPAHIVPIYLGDDVTDEDAFKELNGKGIGIKIDESGINSTNADYWLKDPAEVEKFLQVLASSFTGVEKRWRAGL